MTTPPLPPHADGGAGTPVIETCEAGHHFAKLPDHPKRDGLARCPHCLSVGLAESRLEAARLRRALEEIRVPLSAYVHGDIDIPPYQINQALTTCEDALNGSGGGK